MPQEIRDAYDRWHRDTYVGQVDLSPWYQAAGRWLPDLAGKAVLEIGCGHGDFALSLAQSKARIVIAADFSSVAVAKARAKAIGVPAIQHLVCDIERLPLPDAVFDVVISCETVEHVPRPRLAVEELSRVLRPSGRLILTTPNYMNLMGLYRAYLRMVGRKYSEVGQPLNNLTHLLRTRAWLRRAGLNVEHMSSSGHYIPVRGRWPVAVKWLDDWPKPIGWFGLHSTFVAKKVLS